MLRSAIAISVVICAVLYRAIDTVDVLGVTSASFAIVHVLILSLLRKIFWPKLLNKYSKALTHIFRIFLRRFADTTIVPTFP